MGYVDIAARLKKLHINYIINMVIKMNFALLDDQKSFHEEFKEVSKSYISFENCSYYFNSSELINDVLNKKNWKLDVLFLDIELKDESGIEVAKKLFTYNSSIIVIFLTNKNHLVYEAFGLNVLKFIYKPTFKKQVDNLFVSILKEIDLIKPIQIKTSDSYICFSKKEIIFVARELRKVIFYTKGGKKYESNLSKIGEALELVESEMFVMINRSEIVNIMYISEFAGTKITINGLNKHCYVSQDRLIEVRSKWRRYYV